MADDDTKIDGGQIEDGDGNGQDGNDGNAVDVTEQSDSEFMNDTVKFIKEAKKAELGEDNSDDGIVEDGGVLPDLAGTDIPDAFSEAAEKSGMSKEDIIAMANKHTDDELIEMVASLEASLENTDDNEDDDKVTEQDDKTGDGDGNEIDPELIAQVTEKISKQLEEKFGTTLEDIDKFKASQEEQSIKQTVETASKIFDEASKEFPVFGKTDELPVFPSGRLKGQVIPTSPEMKARLEVLKYAAAFESNGADVDDAMANALATYKGKHLGKELERKQIRDLKNHETKLSGARIGRETKKKYADTREEIIADIARMKREAGIE